MTASKLNRFWTPVILLLVAITVVGAVVAWSRYNPGQPVEISLPPHQELEGTIYIDGAVANPGSYPLQAGDTLEGLIQAAGGATDQASLSELELRIHIPPAGEALEPQKIDINRAEAWLLMALPGIGEAKAQAIIDYRQQNGPFRTTSELTRVAGIGTATYEQIKHLITVAD
jgi:competence protein ComEA